MEIRQYDVYLINLDPTIGHEIRKTRPCLVISPNEMNNNIQTVMIAPMTTKSHSYPSRIKTKLKGKSGFIVLDQIRTVDKKRLVKRLAKVHEEAIKKVKTVIMEMLVD